MGYVCIIPDRSVGAVRLAWARRLFDLEALKPVVELKAHQKRADFVARRLASGPRES